MDRIAEVTVLRSRRTPFAVIVLALVLGAAQAALAETSVVTDIAGWRSPVKKVFNANKIKLQKVEIQASAQATYYADLPFDPMIGRNTSKLEAGIAGANGCRSFAIVSPQDKVKIRVEAKVDAQKHCALDETIDTLP